MKQKEKREKWKKDRERISIDSLTSFSKYLTYLPSLLSRRLRGLVIGHPVRVVALRKEYWSNTPNGVAPLMSDRDDMPLNTTTQ